MRFTVPEISCTHPSARMRFWMAVRLTPYRLDRSDWLAPTSYSARMDSQSNRAAIVAPPVWPAFFLFSQKTFMPSFLLFLGPRTVRQIILPRGPFPLQLRTPVTGLIGHRWPCLPSACVSPLQANTASAVCRACSKRKLSKFLLCGYPQVPLARPEGRSTSFVNVGRGFLPAAPLLPLRAFNHRPQSVGLG